MAKVIEVPGQGPIEFPDSMTDDQIVAAIQKLPKGSDKVSIPADTPKVPAYQMDPQANVQKFLGLLSKAEGADYNTVVGGSQFSDFSKHPNKVGLVTKDGVSTAAGRYQITKSTYDDIAPKIGVFDFSPASQDKIALEIIKRKGALEDIQKGDFQTAINKLGGIWASLPSSKYNQPKKSWDWVNKELSTSYTPFAQVRQNIDPKSLNTDQDWLKASALMYQFWERKPFDGTNDELANWGKDSLGNFNYNMVSMAEIAHAITNASDEEKRAFLYMMDTYDNTNISWEGAKRFGKGVITDPTNLVGIGSLGVGTLAKLGIQATTKTAAKLAIKDLVIQSLARTGIAAGIEGAVYSAADSTIRQGIEVSAGRRKEIDLSKVGVDAAFGAAAGVALGTSADLAISKIFSTIKGGMGGETPRVPTEAPKAAQEASKDVSGVSAKGEGKAVSEIDLSGSTSKLTTEEQSAPKEVTTLYHGTASSFERIDPEKSGGIISYAEEPTVAERYATGGGGQRQTFSDLEKYVITGDGVVYELQGAKTVEKQAKLSNGETIKYDELEGGEWVPVGIQDESTTIVTKDSIRLFEEGKKPDSISRDEMAELTNPNSGDAFAVPKSARIIKEEYEGLKLLDTTAEKGISVIASLNPKTKIGQALVDAAKFDLKQGVQTQFNSNFWQITKSSKVHAESLQKDIIGPLKEMGYDGIRFLDDQHKTVGLFDTAAGKRVTTKLEGENKATLKPPLTPEEQAAVIQRQQEGRLRADEVVPPMSDGTPKIDIPELNTGMRTTRLTDEPAAKLSKAEVSSMADEVVQQLREIKTEELPSVLEGIRTRTDLSDEQRIIRDRAIQDFKNEIVVDLAQARKERSVLDAKAGQLTEAEAVRYNELKSRIEDLEARSAPAVLADDAIGSLAGFILQQRQDPFNALKGVTVESIMKEQGVSKKEAEQVWSEMVGRAESQAELEKINLQYDEKSAQALANDDVEGAIKAVIQKNREIDSKIEVMAPKSASLIQKINEFAISNIFSVKTILINLIPSGIKTLAIPALKAVLNNPFEKATRAEFVASYSAMKSSFSGAMRSAVAGFRYEQALLTRDGTRLVEGELAMTGKLAGAWRIFPRILNASDEFLSRINYDSFVAGRAAANAAIDGAEKGLKGKALNEFIDQEAKKAVDAALRPTKGDELVQPIINKGINLGLTGDELFKWVEKEAMRDPKSLRKGNDEEALQFVREVLYKKAFTGDNTLSKAAQWYEDGMKRFPTIRFLIGQMFFRTPIRVFEEGIRLTPGVQFLAPNMMADLAGKNGVLKQVKAQAEAMSSLVIAAGVLSLYAQGRITGDGAYEDYKQEKVRADGPLPEKYSILMSDGSTWSYKNFDPLATPVKIIVNALERRDKLRIKEAQGLYDGKEADQKLLAAVTVASSSIWTALKDASLVEGANNFSKFVVAAFNPEEGEDKFIKALGDKLFMMVPNTLHKIARDNDPTIKDPQTFWQMVEEKLLKPIGLDDPTSKSAYAYDVIGNVRKMSDTGVLWNVFSTSTIEERTKGLSEKEQFVLAEMDRLSRTTGVTWKPPVKAKELGDFDMRTVMASDGKRTLYDVWQENYRSLNPADKLFPILAAPLPEGTFKYKGIKQEEALSMISTLQDAALLLTMTQEAKVIKQYQDELIKKTYSNTGFFDTPRAY